MFSFLFKEIPKNTATLSGMAHWLVTHGINGKNEEHLLENTTLVPGTDCFTLNVCDPCMKHAEQTDVTDADILFHLKDSHCGKRHQQCFSVSHFLL